jgi:hypothetical protein
MSLASQKRRPFNAEGTGKNQLEPSQKNMRDASVFSCSSLIRYPSLNLTGVVNEKPALGYEIFMAFPSERIPKATRHIKVYFLIHSSSSHK